MRRPGAERFTLEPHPRGAPLCRTTTPTTPHHAHHEPPWEFTAAFWDERYASSGRIWSGNPNVRLVEQAGDLVPGHALDVGAGEGADAVWLAERGWTVTALDVSRVALDRAAAHAAATSGAAAQRISWEQVDLVEQAPAEAAYDLVSAQFMHLPAEALSRLHRRLAAAVRPGGTLLVVGHHPADLELEAGIRHGDASMMPTADAVAATLDPALWEVRVAEAQARQVVGPGTGGTVTVTDAVLRARRR